MGLVETHEYDWVVLGGGPAGIAGAQAAAVFGARVALVEREEHVGGAGVNTGTIPSKTLRESALLLSGWRARKLLGVDVSVRGAAPLSEFVHHERRVVATERERLETLLDSLGVRRFRGHARFADPHTITVARGGGPEAATEPATLLRGERILIATGSSPARPREFPFEHPRVHDSNEILDIADMPRSLAVIGAGVIGAEYACTFAALGVEVHVVDGRDALLPQLDLDVSSALYAAMLEAGIHFHWRERVSRCEPRVADVRLELSSGDAITVSDVLVAAGRTSNTADLALERAGLTPGERGLVTVDATYRTAVPHVYAAGDVIGPPGLASTGMEQARCAVCHALGRYDKSTPSLLPSGIYTIPEVSWVGETETTLRARGVPYVVGRASYAQNARGKIVGDERGFLKLLYREPDLRLVGVHILGEQASEIVHVGLVAMLGDMDARVFERACFNHPTLGELYKQATYQALVRRGTGGASFRRPG